MSTIDPAMPIRVRPDLRVAGAGMTLNDSVYDRLLRERIVFLGQPVDDAIANQICAQLLLLAAEDPKRDIHLYINSPGGSVTAGMAIYDTMQLIESRRRDRARWAWPRRWASSCCRPAPRASATRCRTPGSSCTSRSAGIGGTASDIAIQAEQYKLHQAGDGASSSPSTPARPSSRSRRTPTATAGSPPQQALDYGFVDQVVRPAPSRSPARPAPRRREPATT